MNDEVTVDGTVGEQTVASSSEQPSGPVVSAGAQLTALREANGWSIELVASQLNLAPRQIHALENDNYAALPGSVIVRGFIRAYAKLLRVDPAPILAAAELAPVEADTLLPERTRLAATSFSSSEVPFGRRGPSIPLIAGIVIVLLAILFFVAERVGWVPSFASEPAVQETAKEIDSSAEDEPTEAVPPEQIFADEHESTLPESAPLTVEPVLEEEAALSVPSESMAPSIVQEPESGAPVSERSNERAPAVAVGPDSIVFDVKEDSWVEMRRADDSIFVSRVFKAGTTESFNLPGPISLVIGNAAGVKVRVRGKSLDVNGNASNVARLDVK